MFILILWRSPNILHKCLVISDSDLHMTALALELCCTLMTDRRSSPNVGLTVRDKVLPQALTLVRSSLLQGQALTVLNFGQRMLLSLSYINAC